MFYNKIFSAFNTSFPLIKSNPSTRGKKTTLPWLTPTLIAAIHKKSRLLRKFTKNRSPQNKVLYTQFRNHLKSTLRHEEKNYYSLQFMNKSQNSKATWKLINELLCNNHTSSSTCPTLIKDNISYTAPHTVAEMFNNHFSAVGSTLSQQIPPTLPSYNFAIVQALSQSPKPI
jgi:hypothetical protein